VHRVTDEHETAGEDAGDELNDHHDQGQHDTDEERAPLPGPMQVYVMVMVVVMVGVVVMRVSVLQRSMLVRAGQVRVM
jgi:hypothetical protein